MHNSTLFTILILALAFEAGAGTYDNGGSTDPRVGPVFRLIFNALDNAVIANDWDTGVSGGRTIYGGSGAGNTLTIEATSSATDGVILLYDSTFKHESGAFSFNVDGNANVDAHFAGDLYDNLLYLKASNNRCGIGTATPGASLEVVGTTILDALTTNGAHVLEGGAIDFNKTGNGDYDVNLCGDTYDNVFYLDAGNHRIGIGTSTPGTSLEVVGGTTLDALTTSGTLTFEGGALNYNATGNADLDFHFAGDLYDNLLYGDASNNRVGIGTNAPATSLEVVGTSKFTGAHTLEGGALNFNVTANGDYDVNFAGDLYDNLLYLDAGNQRVGIGTATPGSSLEVVGTVTATAFSGNGASITGLGTTINTQIDAYSNNSAEINLIWTAFMYQGLGPAEKTVPATGAVNVGYAVTDGTAVVGLDTWEVLDAGQRVSINATGEVFAVRAVTDISNTSECYLLITYDSGFVCTKGAEVAVGGSPVIPAVPAGDSPVLLIKVSNNNAAVFNWGTTNWNAAGVTTTVYPIKWPASGASAYAQ